jgi:hypothetical protein
VSLVRKRVRTIRIARLVVDLHVLGLGHPLAQGFIRGQAFRAAERLLEAGADGGCAGDGSACRHVGSQQRAQPSPGTDRQPATDGVAMHPEEGCHLLAVAGLATGP